MQNQIRNSKFKPGKQYWKHTNIHVVYLDLLLSDFARLDMHETSSEHAVHNMLNPFWGGFNTVRPWDARFWGNEKTSAAQKRVT